jgi:aldose 1-epimerase
MRLATITIGVALALSAVTASPVAAKQYAARRSGDVVQLEDMKNHTVVSIIPSVGNIAFEMTVNGTNVLRWPYASVDEFKARPALSAIPFLSPWANRLDEQGFYANGTHYAFDMELGNVRGAIPIHGFLSTTSEWELVEARADGKSAWVTSRLAFYKQPMWMKQFPFAHTVAMTHRLQDGVLQVQTAITNMAAEPMPVAIGFHPYFRLTDSGREEWSITVPAKTRWLLAPPGIPTGRIEPAGELFSNTQPAALKDYSLDDVFGDLVRDAQGRAHAVVKGRQQQIEVMLGPNFRSLVVWSPDPLGKGKGSNESNKSLQPARGAQPAAAATSPSAGRGAQPNDPNYICFEPMAGITDALNLAQKGLYNELQSIPPGGTWQESFWIKPSGF